MSMPYSSRETICFVHFGPSLPPFLKRNIRYLLTTFPSKQIVLITDGFETVNDIRVKTIEFQAPIELKSVLAKNPISDFRQGFWTKSLLRLVALGELRKHFEEDVEIVHLESDILIFPSFPSGILESAEFSIAWMSLDEGIDMPAIIYGTPASFEWLAIQVCGEIAEDPRINDMNALYRIRQAHKSIVGVLPSLPRGLSYEDGQVVSASVKTAGLFDPAYYGQWFIGEQPRNKWGLIARKRALRHFLNLSDFSLNIQKTDLSLVDKYKASFTLYNLHIHSKEKKFFSKNSWKVIARRANSLGENKFSLSGFLLRLRDLFNDIANWISRKLSKSSNTEEL